MVAAYLVMKHKMKATKVYEFKAEYFFRKTSIPGIRADKTE